MEELSNHFRLDLRMVFWRNSSSSAESQRQDVGQVIKCAVVDA